jgi:hypothetical protein
MVHSGKPSPKKLVVLMSILQAEKISLYTLVKVSGHL